MGTRRKQGTNVAKMAIPWYICKHYVVKYSKFTFAVILLLILSIVLYRYIRVTLIAWSFLIGTASAYCYLSLASFFLTHPGIGRMGDVSYKIHVGLSFEEHDLQDNCGWRTVGKGEEASPDQMVPNFLFMYTRRKKRQSNEDDEFTLLKTVCTVCGLKKCPRHRPELNILAFQPWTNLEIKQSVDDALDEFLTIVLNEFVYTWYRNLSTDEEFVDELRTTLRFFLSVVLRRMKKVDVPSVVTEKLVKAGLQHLHAYLKARKSAPEGADLQKVTLEYMGPNLHYAMTSRKSELEYLRRLVEKLFPYILRPQALESKAMCALVREILAGSVVMPAMDALANPDMVNNMILVFLDDSPPPEPPAVPSPMVPFLGGFANQKFLSLSDPELPVKTSKSSLRFVLGEVMDPEKPEKLYPFMQFLKSEAAINVLQFALTCEDFNKRILNPDLNEVELIRLHTSVGELYQNYCAPSAPDRIKFEENIVNELKEIVDGDPIGVVKLRTSTPMFRAYEHVYNLLSYTFLPLFHQSEDYYTMICGSRSTNQSSNRSSCSYLYTQANQNYFSRQPKKREFVLANLGSKIKGVFKASESKSAGDEFGDIDNVEEADRVTIASNSSLEDDTSMEDLESTIENFQPHDLSSWRVTIPRIGARPDPENPKKQFFVFIIDVRRVDVATDGRTMWTVPRRYHEFYVLEQKLREFHGSKMDDYMLPAKKLIGTKNQDFIDGKREAFEQYLQKLLTKPYLKGSQLLYTFLTEEKSFESGFDINIGKVLKAVPRKLMKEKGQHLDLFLQNFEKSTEPTKPVPCKRGRRGSEVSNQSNSSEKLCTSIYENNADGLNNRDVVEGNQLTEKTDIEGVYDTLIYIARYVFNVPDWFHHVLLTARMFLKPSFESYLDWFIGFKVMKVTEEHRLVSLIHLLRDALFYDTDPPRTDDQKRERFQETIRECLKFLPSPIVMAMGEENHQNGSMTILNVLQQPKLNKQLTYVFLDIAITELFPELNST